METVQAATRVEFLTDTLRRVGGSGDNWCMTWAADGSIITAMDDGNWMHGPRGYSHRLFRITGGPDDFTAEELADYPKYLYCDGGWFGYGITSIDGVLYSFVSKCPENAWSGPFQGIKLLKSADNGKTWFRVNRWGEERQLGPEDPARNSIRVEEMFFCMESGRKGNVGTAYPFTCCEVLQNGRDNRAAQDGYTYIYSPEGAFPHELLLARVPSGEIGQRSAWAYFAGWDNDHPVWKSDLGARRPIHTYLDKNSHGQFFGWYSWLPSVVWNEGLGLYIMTNGATYAGTGLTAQQDDAASPWMHSRSGSLGFWYAEKPWGPWNEIIYKEEWIVDSPENRIYQPKLSPKWISEDGTEMVLIWSDAMKNAEGKSHTVNYRWNQMKIKITI